MFTGCIAVSFLLQVRFRFRKRQMRIAERWFFVVGVAFPFLASTVILADRGFNPVKQGFCFINTDPYVCKFGIDRDNVREYCASDETDVRGENADLYYLVLCAA